MNSTHMSMKCIVFKMEHIIHAREPWDKSSTVAQIYPSIFLVNLPGLTSDDDEVDDVVTTNRPFGIPRPPSPQEFLTIIKRDLPNLNHFVFCGNMVRYVKYSNNLSLFMKAFLIADDDDDDDDDDNDESSTKVNFIDFSELTNCNGTPDEAKLEFLDSIAQGQQNSIRYLSFPGGLFIPTADGSVGGSEESLKGYYHDRLAKIIQNNSASLEILYLKAPVFSPPSGGGGGGANDDDDAVAAAGGSGPADGAPSSLIEAAISNNNTLKFLRLEFRVGDDMMEALIDSLKNNCTLQGFISEDLNGHEQDDIISYYLAMNNLGREDWKQDNHHHLANESMKKLTTLSKIPKPEEFQEHHNKAVQGNEKNSNATTNALYFSNNNTARLSNEKKEFWYTSFVYDFLHYNLDLFSNSK